MNRFALTAALIISASLGLTAQRGEILEQILV
jgi:hypothetical protein